MKRRSKPSHLSVHFSSASKEWSTPQRLFDQLNDEFHFTLDPCSTHDNAKCQRHFTRADNGLIQDWTGETVFMNPPYGREIRHWMRKAYESAAVRAIVVCLVPCRTDTGWWHTYAKKGEVRFLEGRLKFGNATASAPFPSAVAIFPKSRGKRRIKKRPRGQLELPV
jgi:site-specific DNA-methyltransferase (adenine-specific)